MLTLTAFLDRDAIPVCKPVDLPSFLPIGYTVVVMDPDEKSPKKYRIIAGHINVISDVCDLKVEELQ